MSLSNEQLLDAYWEARKELSQYDDGDSYAMEDEYLDAGLRAVANAAVEESLTSSVWRDTIEEQRKYIRQLEARLAEQDSK